MPSDSASYKLEIAFNENVAGAFTVDSPIDGTDGLTDVGLFDGTFDDITDDAEGPYQLVEGTDNQMAAVQPANLTITVARVDEPDFWNPTNPASPLNSPTPGFVPMRPVRLTAAVDAVGYPLFRGYLRHAMWNSTKRSCELYAEDFLLWASRVYPTVPSTGPTTVGSVFVLLVAFVDPMLTPIADEGIPLDDFSADGSLSITQIFTNLLAADLGTIFVVRDGTPVYQQHDTPLARPADAMIVVTDQASEVQAGIDLDAIGTRVTVEKTDPATGAVLRTWSSLDIDAEQRFGRADLAAVSSPYVPGGTGGQSLSDELVFEGVQGKQPLEVTLANVDNATLLAILTNGPLNVFGVLDDFGGTTGDGIIQQISHSISTGLHQAQYLMKARPQKAFTVDSPIDGTDGLRYP
jgi:hypothetical protein